MSEPFRQQWHTLVEGQVYLSMGAGHISSEIFHQMDQEFITLIEASDAKLVHIINDTRYVLSIPPLSEVRKAKHPFHKRMGYNITIKAFSNPIMRAIITISTAITRMRYKDAHSIPEACAFLAQKDPSLPPLSAWKMPTEADITTW
jgi:hypothetical protein